MQSPICRWIKTLSASHIVQSDRFFHLYQQHQHQQQHITCAHLFPPTADRCRRGRRPRVPLLTGRVLRTHGRPDAAREGGEKQNRTTTIKYKLHRQSTGGESWTRTSHRTRILYISFSRKRDVVRTRVCNIKFLLFLPKLEPCGASSAAGCRMEQQEREKGHVSASPELLAVS